MQPSRAERARCPLPICSLQVRLIHFFLCRRPWISSNKSSTPCSPPASPTGGTLFHLKKKKSSPGPVSTFKKGFKMKMDWHSSAHDPAFVRIFKSVKEPPPSGSISFQQVNGLSKAKMKFFFYHRNFIKFVREMNEIVAVFLILWYYLQIIVTWSTALGR